MLSFTRSKKSGPVVGLDIEAGSIAAAEVRSNGSAEITAAAIGPLPAGAFHEGEVGDPDNVAEALKSLFARHKLGKRVRLGVANQRVVVRMLRLPAIESAKELAAAVRFQALDQMPMPLDNAVLEHQVVGAVPAEEGKAPQIDVLVVAARRDMVASLLEPLRRAGLDPVGIDLTAFGMIRALAGGDVAGGVAAQEAVLYCNIGDAMNIAVARGYACLFTRVCHAGLAGIVGRVAAERSLTPEHAAQWLAHVGLESGADQIEGDPNTVADARRALEEGVSGLVDELRLSLDYYRAQEGAVPVGSIVFCGPGSAVPGLVERMKEGLGLPVAVSRPPALAAYEEDVAARLTLPYGLALES